MRFIYMLILIRTSSVESDQKSDPNQHKLRGNLLLIEAKFRSRAGFRVPTMLSKLCISTCTPMFLAAMSTIAKLWKKPQCPSTDEWIKKMWSMYTIEYSSAIRNDKYPPFAST